MDVDTFMRCLFFHCYIHTFALVEHSFENCSTMYLYVSIYGVCVYTVTLYVVPEVLCMCF